MTEFTDLTLGQLYAIARMVKLDTTAVAIRSRLCGHVEVVLRTGDQIGQTSDPVWIGPDGSPVDVP